MNLTDFYKKAMAAAIENDPRGKNLVLRELESRKRDYENLSSKEQARFDMESLENPYADSRILVGNGDEILKTILVGIDIEVAEVLLAETLRNKNIPIDLMLSHHPGGLAFASLYSVMHMQSDILYKFGVPINIAEDVMESRIKEVERKLMPVNHTRTVDAAKLLNIPLICMHTAADNMVATFLQQWLNDKQPYTIEDIIELLMEMPEYRTAEKNNAGPMILLGAKKRRAGKIFVDMTGGTEGSKEIYQSLSSSGINTIVGMHLSEEHRQEAQKNHINVAIAGHIASDTLGMNLLLDRIMTQETLEIVECSGFKRVARA